ncbi:MAG: cyclic nucleotide-binding domain-containing protein [Acidimicrobiales bacterium]|nr:cyclic nucleotide-binding domain-containing protein [Acidimicrobiales bacterium]MCB1014699.1 cyclic nucleotide-binding domain-containing protein [Acidimicrobiales bacterium]
MADDYLEHLRAVPLFAHCSNADLAAIAAAVDELEVEPGRALVTEGEVGKEAFIIVTGEAEVTRGGAHVTTIGAGAPFGEMALVDRSPRNATVTAVTPLRVLVLGQREFVGLMDGSPGFARTILAALAARLRDKDLALYG